MMSSITITFTQILSWVIELYIWVLIAAAVSSWLPIPPRLRDLLDRLTRPVLFPIRHFLPTERYGFDFSPLVAILLLTLLKSLFLEGLYLAAMSVIHFVEIVLAFYIVLLAGAFAFHLFPGLWQQRREGFWPRFRIAVHLLTEPILIPIRQRIGDDHPVDISPLVAIGILLVLLILL